MSTLAKLFVYGLCALTCVMALAMCGGVALRLSDEVRRSPLSADSAETLAAEALRATLEQAGNASVAPCDDFYEHVCGGWLARQDPARDESTFDALAQQLEAQLLQIANEGWPLLQTWYDSCRDGQTRAERGYAALQPLWAQIDALPNASATALLPLLGELHRAGVSAVWDVYTAPDPYNSTVRRLYLDWTQTLVPYEVATAPNSTDRADYEWWAFEVARLVLGSRGAAVAALSVEAQLVALMQAAGDGYVETQHLYYDDHATYSFAPDCMLDAEATPLTPGWNSTVFDVDTAPGDILLGTNRCRSIGVATASAVDNRFKLKYDGCNSEYGSWQFHFRAGQWYFTSTNGPSFVANRYMILTDDDATDNTINVKYGARSLTDAIATDRVSVAGAARAAYLEALFGNNQTFLPFAYAAGGGYVDNALALVSEQNDLASLRSYLKLRVAVAVLDTLPFAIQGDVDSNSVAGAVRRAVQRAHTHGRRQYDGSAPSPPLTDCAAAAAAECAVSDSRDLVAAGKPFSAEHVHHEARAWMPAVCVGDPTFVPPGMLGSVTLHYENLKDAFLYCPGGDVYYNPETYADFYAISAAVGSVIGDTGVVVREEYPGALSFDSMHALHAALRDATDIPGEVDLLEWFMGHIVYIVDTESKLVRRVIFKWLLAKLAHEQTEACFVNATSNVFHSLDDLLEACSRPAVLYHVHDPLIEPVKSTIITQLASVGKTLYAHRPSDDSYGACLLDTRTRIFLDIDTAMRGCDRPVIVEPHGEYYDDLVSDTQIYAHVTRIRSSGVVKVKAAHDHTAAACVVSDDGPYRTAAEALEHCTADVIVVRSTRHDDYAEPAERAASDDGASTDKTCYVDPNTRIFASANDAAMVCPPRVVVVKVADKAAQLRQEWPQEPTLPGDTHHDVARGFTTNLTVWCGNTALCCVDASTRIYSSVRRALLFCDQSQIVVRSNQDTDYYEPLNWLAWRKYTGKLCVVDRQRPDAYQTIEEALLVCNAATILVRSTERADYYEELVDVLPLTHPIHQNPAAIRVHTWLHQHQSAENTYAKSGSFSDRRVPVAIPQPGATECVDSVKRWLGPVLSHYYATEFADPATQRGATQMLAAVMGAFEALLQRNSWMDATTRAAALQKLAAIRPLISYPEHWSASVPPSAVQTGDLVGSALRVLAAQRQRDLAELAAALPVDRYAWEMAPYDVNAYYDPTANDVVIPIGISRSPFFNVSAPLAANFGGLGSVMGHELGHAFDNTGRLYDADGDRRDWWTPASEAAFQTRADCVVRLYDGLPALPDDATITVSGNLTLGENWADLTGLRAAYDAYVLARDSLTTAQRAIERALVYKVFGYSEEQLFFRSWALHWCAHRTRPDAYELAMSDPHAPPRWRVNVPVMQSTEFRKAFGCKARQAPALQCDLF